MLIKRFKKTRAESPMYFYRTPDNAPGQKIDFLVRFLDHMNIANAEDRFKFHPDNNFFYVSWPSWLLGVCILALKYHGE